MCRMIYEPARGWGLVNLVCVAGFMCPHVLGAWWTKTYHLPELRSAAPRSTSCCSRCRLLSVPKSLGHVSEELCACTWLELGGLCMCRRIYVLHVVGACWTLHVSQDLCAARGWSLLDFACIAGLMCLHVVGAWWTKMYHLPELGHANSRSTSRCSCCRLP